MTELDGKRQRNALTAAERALQALGAGNAERAIRSAAKAADLDQLGIFRGLPEAVAGGVADLEATGSVGVASWDRLETAVGPGPLQFLIQELRA
jgi:hypothetical protein